MNVMMPFINVNTQIMMRIISKSVSIWLFLYAIRPQIMLIIAMVMLRTNG
jgi:hypothetical protein